MDEPLPEGKPSEIEKPSLLQNFLGVLGCLSEIVGSILLIVAFGAATHISEGASEEKAVTITYILFSASLLLFLLVVLTGYLYRSASRPMTKRKTIVWEKLPGLQTWFFVIYTYIGFLFVIFTHRFMLPNYHPLINALAVLGVVLFFTGILWVLLSRKIEF